MYPLVRWFLFLFDPERVHSWAMQAFKLICSTAATRAIVRKYLSPPSRLNPISCFGVSFAHPVGLAAGFDKNARYLRELEVMGFASVEIGTVTPLPQAGNERPRLFRLPADRALINRMGFNNEGVREIAARLARWREGNTRLIIGGNIGRNKSTPNEEAWKDYETCFRVLHDWVDYFVVNVSSPNTPGLRELQEKESLHQILSHLQTINRQQARPKPLLLKIAPDLGWSQLDNVIDLAIEIGLDGLVASNTSIGREGLSLASQKIADRAGAGGLSGAPVRDRATEMIAYIRQRSNGSIPVIGSGGIFNGKDAREKLDAGACLVQVWTGFIYEGPAIVKKILREF